MCLGKRKPSARVQRPRPSGSFWESGMTLAAALDDKKHLCSNSPSEKCVRGWDGGAEGGGTAEQKTHNEKPVSGQVLDREQPDTLSQALSPQSRLERMRPVSGSSVICKSASFFLMSDLFSKIHSRVEKFGFLLCKF